MRAQSDPAPAIARHLPIQFLRQRIKLVASPAKRLRLITKHALSRLFHALAKLRDSLPRLRLGLLRLLDKTALQQARARIQCLIRAALVEFSGRIVKLSREQRLGVLGILNRPPDVLKQLLEFLLLLSQVLGDLLSLAGIAQPAALLALRLIGLSLCALSRLRRRVPLRLILARTSTIQIRQSLRQLLLILIELPRILAHAIHGFGELPRCGLSHLLPEVVELFGSAGARGCRLRNHILLK